ncbi:hypothetical protein KCU81_g7002, partial [Aureobasidium melanogenum]
MSSKGGSEDVLSSPASREYHETHIISSQMVLLRVIALAGIAALSSASDGDLGTTLSTKYVEHSPGAETTYSTSWRIKNAPTTTKLDGDDDGWTVVSETESIVTETSTANGTIDSRPNNAMLAHRMAMVAAATWGRFPTKPDDETEACANGTTADHVGRYNNSTVNCTALMFGDRWHGWECDEACRVTLADALPAAILSVVGPDQASSDAVQRSIRDTRELFGRPISFLRLARFSNLLRQAEHYLGVLFREGVADIESFNTNLWDHIRTQIERIAAGFHLNPAATNQVTYTIWEFQFHLQAWFDVAFEPAPDPLTPEYFDTIEEYEQYIRRLLERRTLLRHTLDTVTADETEPLLEELYRAQPDLPEELAERLYREIAPPQYDPDGRPPVYEDPPAYEARRYRAEQDLYDSMSRLAEFPPILEEYVRFGRHDSWPTPAPVTNIPGTTMPVSPTVAPTIMPTELPAPPPGTPETSRIDLAEDGMLTIAGSGAWAIAAEISLTLFNHLTTCTPIDLATWTFIPRATSFLAHGRVASWNGHGVEQCFAREISGLGGPSAESVVTQGFKEYELKLELEINPNKPVDKGAPNKGPPEEESPGKGKDKVKDKGKDKSKGKSKSKSKDKSKSKGKGPPSEIPPKGGKKLKKCTLWMILLGWPLFGLCCP